MLSLLDRLRKSSRFTDVKSMDIRDAGGRTKEIAFTINFTFNGN